MFVCDESKALVKMDPCNFLDHDIHKDLVGYGGEFILVIDARPEDHSENEDTILRLS